jgi:hypothetical protein
VKTLYDFLEEMRQELAATEAFCFKHERVLEALLNRVEIENIYFNCGHDGVWATLRFPLRDNAEEYRDRFIAIADFAESFGKTLHREGEEYEESWHWSFTVGKDRFRFQNVEPRQRKTLRFPARDSIAGSIVDPRVFAEEIDRDIKRAGESGVRL